MRLLHGIEDFSAGTASTESTAPQGLAGWILGLVQGRWRGMNSQQKQLRLVETLALGGKRQLLLIECAGESFLVGGGLDNVQAIIRVQGLYPADTTNEIVSQPCR